MRCAGGVVGGLDICHVWKCLGEMMGESRASLELSQALSLSIELVRVSLEALNRLTFVHSPGNIFSLLSDRVTLEKVCDSSRYATTVEREELECFKL